MKTIFVTSFHSIISKNILNSDALKGLLGKGLRIVIFVPSHKKELFQAYYTHPDVIFEGIDMRPITEHRINNFMMTVARLLVDSHYLWYKQAERRAQASSIYGDGKYFLERFLVKLFSGSTLAHAAFRFVDRCLRRPFFHRYFEQYKPDLVFVTDLFDKVDTSFLREAKAMNVRSIGMVRSWDNCYSKGLMQVIPDKILANNYELLSQLIDLHDVQEHQIEVVGLPQFDMLLRTEPTDWKTFAQELGLNPSRRLVLISPLGAPLSYVDWEILQILQTAVREKKLPEDIQFLVRLHPGRELPLGSFVADDCFIFDTPGIGGGKDVEFRPTDVNHLYDSIYHSRAIIWVATTLGIDALVLDKPQIVANFDGTEKKPYIDSVKRYHDEDHMKKMLDIGGMRVTDSPEAMISALKAYLADPSLDRDKRQKVIDQQIVYMDGRSGERIARAVLAQLE